MIYPSKSNHFLASLEQSEFEALRPHLQDIELPVETVLFESGDTISQVYFPLSGIVSLVVDQDPSPLRPYIRCMTASTATPRAN